MARISFTKLGGLNLYMNPLLQNSGDLIRSVNVTTDQYGAKTRRSGYIPYLGTADGSAITTLFTWYKNDGSTFFNYRTSGSSLYYSLQGTGSWTLAGNGTIGAGATVSYAVLDNTLVVADGVGSTRHTTNGTAFTNTTLAPVAVDLVQYQNRVHALGTSSDDFYSTTNDATNWNTSGTSDSSSIKIPGAGKLLKGFKANDRLILTKNSALMFRWDGYSLVDLSSELGMTSAVSVDKSEDYWFWVNRLGHFGYGGSKPQLLSNSVQKLFYNNSGSAVTGSKFNTIPGKVHRYDYFMGLGTVTDDFTNETITNAVLKYDYQKNEYGAYSLAHNPLSFHSFKDASGDQQFIFGDAVGQCYQFSGTANTDNGTAIESVMEFFSDLGAPELEKKLDFLDVFFNPGCQAHVQIAITDSFHRGSKKWIDIGDVSAGHTQWRFPQGSRGRFLFVKITDASKTAPYVFYGMVVNFDPINR